jgi:hypothetical protein
MSAANQSVLSVDVNEVPRAIARATKRDNVLYPLSAFFMLLGCFLIVMPHIYEFLELAELLALLGVITLYEGMVIATVVYIARRAPDSRDLPVLSFIELLFLLDATFTVNACLPVSSIGGPITVVVALAFAYAKIVVMHRTSRVGVYGGVLPFVLPAMAFLYLFQVVFQGMRGSIGDERGISTYVVYLIAGALVFLLEFVETRRDGDDGRPAWLGPRWRRTVIGVTAAAVGMQLVGQSWVHQVPFDVVFLLPVALSVIVVWPRPRAVDGEKEWKTSERLRYSQMYRAAAIGVALAVGLLCASGMTWSWWRDGVFRGASPFRLSLVYASAMLIYLWRRERSGLFRDMAFVTLVLAVFGSHAKDMTKGLLSAHSGTIAAYAYVAGMWLALKRSHRRVVIALTPLLAMLCAHVAQGRHGIDGDLEFFRYWPVAAFAAGLLLKSRDRGLRFTLAAVMFIAGVAAFDVDSVNGTLYAGVVLVTLLAAALYERRAYGVVAGVYALACVGRAYALVMPSSASAWGAIAIVMAFVLFAVGIQVTRSRLTRREADTDDMPRIVPVSTPDIVLRFMAAVGVIGLLLAAVPPMGCRHGGSAGNETSAIAGCVVVLVGQATFHKTDFYGIGQLVYANARDGKGLGDLRQLPDGTEVGLIDRSLSLAVPGGTPKGGYVFTLLDGSVDGGPYDPSVEFAVCAVPAVYDRSGRNMFVMDTGGTVYQAEARSIYPDLRVGQPVEHLRLYPSQEELRTKWIAVGQ